MANQHDNSIPDEAKKYAHKLFDLIDTNAEIARLMQTKFNLPYTSENYRATVSRWRIAAGKASTGTHFRKKNKKRLFFDLETSPNVGIFWRSGYKQNINYQQITQERRIICVSYKWQGANKMTTITWDKDQCDKSLIEKFSKIMLQADEIVGHNSDRFDEPWLRTRAVYHRLPMLPKYKSLDTYKKAKTHFNFQSNSLKYIADFLNVSQKGSAGGLDTWKDIMFKNDKKAMKNMVQYCEQDVLVLEDVFTVLNPYIYGNTNFGKLDTGHKFLCPECSGEDLKYIKSTSTQAGTIHRIMECQECQSNCKLNNKSYMDFLKYSMGLGGL